MLLVRWFICCWHLHAHLLFLLLDGVALSSLVSLVSIVHRFVTLLFEDLLLQSRTPLVVRELGYAAAAATHAIVAEKAHSARFTAL